MEKQRRPNAFEDELHVRTVKSYRDAGQTKQLMEYFYEMLDKYPDDMVASATSSKEAKAKSIVSTIEYFTQMEEYEKCSRLKELMEKLEREG